MRFKIKNFRSIKEQEIELAPITVVYGPNGSGKSSLLYALLTLKNVVLNPNQNTNGFFNYAFANLGNFEAVVFDHQTRNEIELGVKFCEGFETILTYQVVIGENEGSFILSAKIIDGLRTNFQLPVDLPDKEMKQEVGN